MILATTDKHNAAPDLGLLPIAVFIIVLSLGVSWGMESMCYLIAWNLLALLTRTESVLVQPSSWSWVSSISFDGRLRRDALHVSWVSPNFIFLSPPLSCARASSDALYSNWTLRRQYWLWGGFIAPTLGAIIAIGFYDLLLRRQDPVQTFFRLVAITEFPSLELNCIYRDSIKADENAIWWIWEIPLLFWICDPVQLFFFLWICSNLCSTNSHRRFLFMADNTMSYLRLSI